MGRGRKRSAGKKSRTSGGTGHDQSGPERKASTARLQDGGAPRRSGRNASPTRWIAAAVVLVVLVMAAVVLTREKPDEEALGTPDVIKIETDKGLVTLEVYPKAMPVTVANFEKLAGSGFYDGLVWHRVEDWVVQTGDPLGTGRGGSEETIKLEVSPKLQNVRSAVGMARSEAPDSASSQFYVLKKDAAWLDGKYAVFGIVVSGMDVVDRLEAGDKMIRVTVESGTTGR